MVMIVGTLSFDTLNTSSIDGKGCCKAAYQARRHTASKYSFQPELKFTQRGIVMHSVLSSSIKLTSSFLACREAQQHRKTSCRS